MDANELMEDLKRRLTALAENPPFRFKRTSRSAARQYMQRMTTFRGCSANEIASAEATLEVRFTDVFKAYLLHLSLARGHLLSGSRVAQPAEFAAFGTTAQEILHDTDRSLQLPSDAVVFLTHQGYQFQFIQPHGEYDCPVWLYTETDQAPEQICPTFAEYLDREVRQLEENHRQSHETGGFYITVHGNQGVAYEFPALASGERATAKPFRLGDGWLW